MADLTDKAIIVEIYNSKMKTRALAAKYKCTTGEIARIKGKIEPYRDIINDWQNQMARFLFRREFGYDIFSEKTQSKIQNFKKSA